MNDILIYGAGGFGKEIACLIKQINDNQPTWNVIGYLDDNAEIWGKPVSHFGVCLGGIDFLNTYPKEVAVVLGIGSANAVKKIRENITNPKISFPNLIHPSFRMNDPESFKIGEGNIIQSQCIASCDVAIGNFNVMNGSICFAHDVVVGDYNIIMPGVRISGETKIGEQNFLGVGSIVLQQIRIGNRVRLGAGSVLMTKPKDGMLYMGNPARKTEL